MPKAQATSPASGAPGKETPTKNKVAEVSLGRPTDVLPPERLGLHLQGGMVQGKLPLRVSRELHGVCTKRSRADEAMKQLAASWPIAFETYAELLSLLSLSTLDHFGLHPNAPERFGLRRVDFSQESGQRFRGSLDTNLQEDIRRMTWMLLEEEEERFLKTILQRSCKNGPDFFVKQADYERLMDLRQKYAPSTTQDAA